MDASRADDAAQAAAQKNGAASAALAAQRASASSRAYQSANREKNGAGKQGRPIASKGLGGGAMVG